MKTKLQNDSLFILIKSLTKSEKRQFKLFVGRLEVNSNSKFLNLFNFLDKAKTYEETEIIKAGIVKKQQLANLKSHLYKQILISLKLNPSHKNIRTQIREDIDFATILYNKGLYNQSLKILDKTKSIAQGSEEKNLAYEIIELEKLIESQYITRSTSGRSDELTLQSKTLSKLNVIASKLSNLSLQLYGMYLKSGYIKDKQEAVKITAYFYKKLPEYNFSKLGFREKIWLFKAFLWYSFLVQDFKNCYRYALKWVNLYDEYPDMVTYNPVFFLKGNHYLLEALFYIGDYKKFSFRLHKFIALLESPNFPKGKNVEALRFLYIHYNKINLYFMNGDFVGGLHLIPSIENKFKLYDNQIDKHHFMIFYYKFASLQFGASQFEDCIYYLDKIISNKSTHVRQDLMCFSRLLNLLAHYEAGLDYNFEALLKSTYKFLIKMNDLYKVQMEVIKFIKELRDVYPNDLKQAFKKLHATLKTYEADRYERRSFLYLDLISWLESKIYNTSISQIIERKNELNHKPSFF